MQPSDAERESPPARHQRVPGGVGQRGPECQLHALHSVAHCEEMAFGLNALLIFDRQSVRNDVERLPDVAMFASGATDGFSASEKLACERRQ
jgi:hypothetical protein